MLVHGRSGHAGAQSRLDAVDVFAGEYASGSLRHLMQASTSSATMSVVTVLSAVVFAAIIIAAALFLCAGSSNAGGPGASRRLSSSRGPGGASSNGDASNNRGSSHRVEPKANSPIKAAAEQKNVSSSTHVDMARRTSSIPGGEQQPQAEHKLGNGVSQGASPTVSAQPAPIQGLREKVSLETRQTGMGMVENSTRGIVPSNSEFNKAPPSDRNTPDSSHAKEVLGLRDDTQSFPWHATSPQETMLLGGNKIPPGDGKLLQRAIKEVNIVHSLDTKDLLFKYGSWFTNRYSVMVNRKAGVGSTATVYCGLYNGERAAFKVMNGTVTIPKLINSVLQNLRTELEVFRILRQSTSHVGSRYINIMIDCQMFPPFTHVAQLDPRLGDSRISDDDALSGRNSLPSDVNPAFLSAPNDTDGDFHNLANMRSDAAEPGGGTGNSSSGGKFRHDDYVNLQIVQVFPLCELGQMLRLCRGKTKLPTFLLPPECVGQIVSGLPDEEYKAFAAKHSSPAQRSDGALNALEHYEMMSGKKRSWETTMHITNMLMNTDSNSKKTFLKASMIPVHWITILKLQLLMQVLTALQYLHECGIIHCDVKLDNVFLTADPTCKPFGIAAKLSDLGMCRTMTPAHSELPSSSLTSRYTLYVKGTPGYCAPEMLKEGRIGPALDVYSFAVMCIVSLCPNAVFKKSGFTTEVVANYPDDTSPTLVQTLNAAMDQEYSKRPGLAEVEAALGDEMERTMMVIIEEAQQAEACSRSS